MKILSGVKLPQLKPLRFKKKINSAKHEFIIQNYKVQNDWEVETSKNNKQCAGLGSYWLVKTY